MTKLKVQVIFNNQKWANEQLYLNELGAKMKERSSDRVELEFLPSIYTNFTNFPFLVYIAGGIGVSAISDKWYHENISELSNLREPDVTLFVANKKDYATSFDGRTTYGFTYYHFGGKYPIECQIMCEEGDKSFKYPQFNAFSDYTIHEIVHGLYQLGDETNNDRCHVHYLSGPDGINKAFDDFDYELINKKKGQSMRLVEDKGTVYLISGNQVKQKIGIATKIEQVLELFGDEPITHEDTSAIPESFTLAPGFLIHKK